MKKCSIIIIFLVALTLLAGCAKKVEVPEYEILDSVELLSGEGRYADVLVPSLSQDTPEDDVEAILSEICKIENLYNITIYSTQEAYEANYSQEFLKEHPNALNDGFIASKNGSNIYFAKDFGY